MSGESPDGADGDVETTLALLADDRRRELLRAVYDGERASSVAELAERVRGDDDRPAGLYEIHHRHLPMLDSADWVQFDAADGTVEPGDAELVRESVSTAAERLAELESAIE